MARLVTDPERLAVLRRTELLDSPAEEAFDRLTRLASRLLGAPTALVTLLDANRQFFKACVGVPESLAETRELPLSESFCQYAVALGRPLAIEDAREHPLVRGSAGVKSLGIRSYLGIPLIAAGGHGLGTFCIFDTRPRTWTEEDVELLEDLAAAAVTEIELRAENRVRHRAESLLAGQKRLLELVARGTPLREVLDALVRMIEAESEELTGSILLVDEEEGRLRRGAAPSLPEAINAALDGVGIEPVVGPCGVAARCREPVVSDDLEADARWKEPFRSLVREHGFRSCWSTPIEAADGTVLGTFALYRRRPSAPSAQDRELIGIATHIAGIAIERDRSERALRESEERLRELAENVRDAFWITDPTFRTLLYVSPAYEQIWGRSCESLYADPWSCVEAIHPEDRERVVAALERAAEDGLDELYRVVRPDGSIRWVHDRGFPIRDEEGRVRRIGGLVEDITERKRAEDRERFLAEATAVLTSSLDYEDTLRELARVAVPVFADACVVEIVDDARVVHLAAAHVDPELEEILLRMRDRFPPGDDPAHPSRRVLESGEALLAERVEEARWAALARSPEHLEGLKRLAVRSALVVPLRARGETLGVCTFLLSGSGRSYDAGDRDFAMDLARRAALALDNASLYREAQQANQAKADFLAVMSHELRTPLSAITGYTDLWIMGLPEPLSEPLRQQVERVRTSARHLLGLIDQLLTFSRIEAGQERVRLEPVDLAALVGELTALVEPLALEKGLRFETAVRGATEPFGTDSGKLRQVLLNLLSNAIKFTEAGEVELVVEAREGGVVCRVRDTGIGIAPEHREKIFEPFWQVERGTTRKVEGTGLGLGVARRLAGLLGGDITLESAPGAGSTFEVTLPAGGGS